MIRTWHKNTFFHRSLGTDFVEVRTLRQPWSSWVILVRIITIFTRIISQSCLYLQPVVYPTDTSKQPSNLCWIFSKVKKWKNNMECADVEWFYSTMFSLCNILHHLQDFATVLKSQHIFEAKLKKKQFKNNGSISWSKKIRKSHAVPCMSPLHKCLKHQTKSCPQIFCSQFLFQKCITKFVIEPTW